MKKVVIFGAAGHTGKYITRKMRSMEGVEVTAFVRNPAKFSPEEIENVTVIQGDALNASDVKRAMEGQDILLCSLEGDVLTMAKNIVDALSTTSVRRIVWITGMGIHGEVKGMRGIMLGMLAKQRPEYIKAADAIAASGVPATLLRCPGIQNGENTGYCLTPESEQPAKRNVDRAAIAQFMADVVVDEALGANESLGITNN